MPAVKGQKYNIEPKPRIKKVFDKVMENNGSVSGAMKEVGYPETTAKNPQQLTRSKSWEKLLETHLPDKLLAEKHKELLNSTRIDHMIFPLGPKGEDDINFSGGRTKKGEEEGKQSELTAERTTLSDTEIIAMLAEVNCKVRRIVHGEIARHVYFWSADNNARKNGLDLAYKIKNKVPKEQPEDNLEGLKVIMVQINNVLNAKS